MLATLVIVFREVIEAGLIIGVVLAATKGVPLRGLWVSYGVAGGVAGACLVALFASAIAGLFEGSGQELFNASILLLAVAMLIWHNVWMASHGREMAQEMKEIGGEVSAGNRSLTALAIVVGIAVLREGSEIVLFLYGIAASGGASSTSMLLGGLVGIASGAVITALLYFGLLAIPTRKLFAVTTGLITLLAAGLAAQAVFYLQQAGYLRIWTRSLWNTSWLLDEHSLVGQLLHTLIGYSARPNAMQLIAYLGTIALIIVLMRTVRTGNLQASGATTADS